MEVASFRWGPLARGSYIAMLWFSIVIEWHFSSYLVYYLLFLVFLGLGLRPLLEKSGLYSLAQSLLVAVEAKQQEERLQEHRRLVARNERDKKYRQRRKLDPKLPKNW